VTRRVGAAAAVLMALAASGCSGISMDSPVQPGLEVGAAQGDPVRVLFPGPAAGSSPVQMVQGFLRAGAASDQEYEVARSFMTPSPDTTWRPDTSIMIYTDDTAVTVSALDESTVRARAKVVASIDGNGRYRDLPAGTVAEATFRLQQTGGEWRITGLQEGFGLWLSASDAERLYDPFRIHYVSTSGRQLVPDIRWFPLGKGLATRLARAQLGDVPAYLQGAARSDIPVGTRLTVDAVPVDNGLATVDLTATKPGGDPIRRQNLWAQFVATLTQVPDVSRVALKVEGTNLELPGMSTAPSSLSDLGFPTPAAGPAVSSLLRTGSLLFRVDPTQLADQGGADPSRTPAQPSAILQGWVWLALSKNGQEVAAVGGDRAELARWRGSSQISVPFFGSRLTPPTYDSQNFLWVGGQTDGRARLWTVNASADPGDAQSTRPMPVDAPWLSRRLVVAQRVASDGQRVAVISTAPGGQDPRIDVAGVVRAENGRPEKLADPVRIASTLTLARDLVWVDQTTVAVLGRITPSSPVRVWTAEVGGRLLAAEVSDVPGARAITSTNGERGLVVVSDGGEVLLRAGSSWLDIADGSDFAVPAT
jgi:lipoprotein LpqB-like beta-propeller protein/sporulation and spore germination protein